MGSISGEAGTGSRRRPRSAGRFGRKARQRASLRARAAHGQRGRRL